MIRKALPDAAARERIRTDLDTSLLVEAGAGSGKTTALLDRMIALLVEGRAEVREIAAVTFTRKAASELREGFQTRLEAAVREARAGGDTGRADRLDRALREIDRAFLGTIHSFCARLLRERPIEAGLDPGFREVVDPEAGEIRRRFWHAHLERLHTAGDDALVELADLGIRPVDLYDGFQTIDDNRDVAFPAEPVDRPRSAGVRRELGALLDRAERLVPPTEPEKGWDRLQKLIRRLRFARYAGWEDDAEFFDALAGVVGLGGNPVIQKRWTDDPEEKERVKALRDDFLDFGQGGGPAARALDRWYAHRYPAVIGFCRRAADAWAAERRRRGRLVFQDLLMGAARLLRESPAARRDLGGRYRYLLVDEFQDTDPIQAEVAFLLTADDPDEPDWTKAAPRPGALFVVGDPKQSIYRFRRADIVVYQMARNRFEALPGDVADVVELVTNFRSLPAIESYVNEEFEGRFGPEATPEQAAFAPMRVHREDDGPQGVFLYEVADASKDADVARNDAGAVAAWIDGRIRAGERSAGDFLILTHRRKALHHYGRALEARNVAVEVTGAEMPLDEELSELRILLRALVDPDDATLTFAVLRGLFFGLDYETMTRHALAGGSFRLAKAGEGPEGPVRDALETLRGWWRLARSAPADVAVPAILADLGLLPYAAAGELGAARAGAIRWLLDVVRRAGLEGDTSLRAALDGLEIAFEAEDAAAPLEPGREDVVRVMNLHKAKGTEAPVVILAAPTGTSTFEPRMRVVRRPGGDAEGFLEVGRRGRGRRDRTILARPLDWRDHRTEERRFEQAEEERLLYVAATRARDELLVSRCPKKDSKSFWRPLYEGLGEREKIELAGPAVPERRRLECPAADLAAEIEAAAAERAARRAPGWEVRPVTALVEGDPAARAAGSGGRGRAWGSAVHEALAAACRGLPGHPLDDGDLPPVCRAALLAHSRPVDGEGEPRETDELVALVRGVLASDLGRRIRAAGRVLVEVPFALPEEGAGPLRVVEGVVDLAFREAGGWVIVDWKTDEVDDPGVLAARREKYRAQVDMYAECWETITGEPEAERSVRFLAPDPP